VKTEDDAMPPKDLSSNRPPGLGSGFAFVLLGPVVGVITLIGALILGGHSLEGGQSASAVEYLALCIPCGWGVIAHGVARRRGFARATVIAAGIAATAWSVGSVLVFAAVI
jgi:hypothetical protein